MAIVFKDALQRLLESNDLTHAEMLDVMHQVMSGELTPAQIAGFLIALRIKGETVDEIAAAAEVMRELATHVTIRDDALVATVFIPLMYPQFPLLLRLRLAPKSRSMAAVRFLLLAAARTCWKHWASMSIWRLIRLLHVSMISASVSCSRPIITAPCAMLHL